MTDTTLEFLKTIRSKNSLAIRKAIDNLQGLIQENSKNNDTNQEIEKHNTDQPVKESAQPVSEKINTGKPVGETMQSNMEQSVTDQPNQPSVHQQVSNQPMADGLIPSFAKQLKHTMIKSTVIEPVERNKLCSIMLPVYNNKEDILDAIQSVIEQKYQPWELIIIDDCSTDGTYEVIKNFITANPFLPIKLFRNLKNRGVYVSMNEALIHSNGTYIALINSDDKYHPEILTKSIAHLERDPKLVASISKCQRNKFISYSPVSLVYRKYIINEIGYYDSVRFAADSEFLNRILTKYTAQRVKFIDEILYFAKRRENSLTTSPETGKKGQGLVARKAYVAEYTKWHKKGGLYIEYPQKKRPFPVPNVMLP